MKKTRQDKIFDIGLDMYSATGDLPTYPALTDAFYEKEDVIVSCRDIKGALNRLKCHVNQSDLSIDNETAKLIGRSVVALVNARTQDASPQCSTEDGSEKLANVVENNLGAMSALQCAFGETLDTIESALSSGDREATNLAVKAHRERMNGLMSSIIELNERV